MEKQNVTALDFETTLVPYFDRKGKKSLSAIGHPRFAKAILSSLSDGIQAKAFNMQEHIPVLLDGTVFHNISFDGLVGVQNNFWSLSDLKLKDTNCTALMAKILRNDKPAALKSLARDLLGENNVCDYSTIDKDNELEFKEYNAKDALYTARVFHIFKSQLLENAQWNLYKEIELPFALLNMECELNGILVDCEKLLDIRRQYAEEVLCLEKEVTEENINFNSPKQVKQFLYGTLNLPFAYQKGKVSTSKKALKKLDHPKVKSLIKRQSLIGLTRQLDGILKFIDKNTGLIHPYINTIGADTGRCTSSNPNLQNVSKDSIIREIFVARPGHKIIVLDFGQIEPRVLAHFLGKGLFRSLFDQAEDVYAYLGRTVFSNVNASAPTRAIAKQVILGVMYGLGPKTMSENLGCTVTEAEGYLQSFYTYFPEVLDFKNEVLQKARVASYSEGLLNRRRYIENLNSENNYERFSAEREAINAVIQGSATTLFKSKLVQLREKLPKEVRFLLHVHDEVILEAPEEMADEVLKFSKQLLQEPVHWFSIPLTADGGVGSNWAQAKGV